ncbi:MAG: hypothetical protein A2Z14_02225 [Chloroflexi bacterium RBG_16_48_8]|nr:MAG: hypothetical protein A2Z14_02225 [Chloroflexi bacterium RBG_16_48_8]
MTSVTLQIDEILTLLTNGKINIVGRFLWGSNYTFLVEVKSTKETIAAVYKPSRGERPLWDFPRGTLAAREVAAYITSQALGWDLVPPTVLRQEGPAGPGSMQLFVDADVEHHYFTFSDEEKQRLRPVALFDVLVNNADRKGGHVLMSPDGHIWSIDHGICFHQEDKLRTVIWDFAYEFIPDDLIADTRAFYRLLLDDEELQHKYIDLLSVEEFQTLILRTERVLEGRCFPEPFIDRPYPWPMV